jgi:hypothetical protein
MSLPPSRAGRRDDSCSCTSSYAARESVSACVRGETWVDDTGSFSETDSFLPGSREAIRQGCLCSVLANASYRTGATKNPFIDPGCALHSRGAEASGAPAEETR